MEVLRPVSAFWRPQEAFQVFTFSQLEICAICCDSIPLLLFTTSLNLVWEKKIKIGAPSTGRRLCVYSNTEMCLGREREINNCTLLECRSTNLSTPEQRYKMKFDAVWGQPMPSSACHCSVNLILCWSLKLSVALEELCRGAESQWLVLSLQILLYAELGVYRTFLMEMCLSL